MRNQCRPPKAFQPKAMLTANDSIEVAMDSEDADNTSASVLDFIYKEQKNLVISR